MVYETSVILVFKIECEFMNKQADVTAQTRLEYMRWYIVKFGEKAYRRNRKQLAPLNNFQLEADNVCEPQYHAVFLFQWNQALRIFIHLLSMLNVILWCLQKKKKNQDEYMTRSARSVRPSQKMNL